MSQMFFGQFLLEESAVGEEELQQALERANKEHIWLGQLGIESGLLSEEQVELIHLEQRSCDLRFGELAIVLELLSREQLAELLREQKRRHKPVGEALVEQGSLSQSELDDLLDRYYLSQIDLDVVHLGLPFELADDDLAAYLVSFLPKLYRRITREPMKLQAARAWHGRSNLPLRFEIDLAGETGLVIGLAGCDAMARRIATTLAGPGCDLGREGVVEHAFLDFGEILADAASRSARESGIKATPRLPRVDRLPEGGFWLPATTPTGRGILVLAPT